MKSFRSKTASTVGGKNYGTKEAASQKSIAIINVLGKNPDHTTCSIYHSSGRKVTQFNFYGLLLALHTN
jgi:hypothetical protein